MAHINAIGASVFTTLHYVELTEDEVTRFGVGGSDRDTATNWQDLFDDASDEVRYTSYARATAVGTFNFATAADATAAGNDIAAENSGLTLGTALAADTAINITIDGTEHTLTPISGATLTVAVSGTTVTITQSTGTLPNASPVIPAGGGLLQADPRPTVEVTNLREFPSVGTPANIVNVPQYGQSISSQISGQADAPTLEFTLNYVPSKHASIDQLRRDKKQAAWRIRLADAETAIDGQSSDLFDDFYFVGTVGSFEITPSLTDSMQATFSLTIDGDFQGPFSDVEGTYGR